MVRPRVAGRGVRHLPPDLRIAEGEVAAKVASSNHHEESWFGAWTGAESGGPSDDADAGDDSPPEGQGPPPADDVPVDPPAGDDDPPDGPSGPTDGDGGGPTAVPGCTGPQGGTYDDLLGDWSPYGDDRTVDDPFDDDQGYLGGAEEAEAPDPSDILPDGEVQLPPEEEPPPEPPLDPSRAFVQFIPVVWAGEVAVLIEGVLLVVGVVLLAAGALETDNPKKNPPPCGFSHGKKKKSCTAKDPDTGRMYSGFTYYLDEFKPCTPVWSYCVPSQM